MTTPEIKKYVKRRDEWVRTLQTMLTPVVHAIIIDAKRASDIYAAKKDKGKVYKKPFEAAIEYVTKLKDEEMKDMLRGVKLEDMEASLQHAVKNQAVVVSMGSSNQCCTTIEVPKVTYFVQAVITTAFSEIPHGELCSRDVKHMTLVRKWIDNIVRREIVSIVPIVLFSRTVTTVTEEAKQVVPPTPPQIQLPQQIEQPAPAPAPQQIEPAPAPQQIEQPAPQKKDPMPTPSRLSDDESESETESESESESESEEGDY